MQDDHLPITLIMDYFIISQSSVVIDIQIWLNRKFRRTCGEAGSRRTTGLWGKVWRRGLTHLKGE